MHLTSIHAKARVKISGLVEIWGLVSSPHPLMWGYASPGCSWLSACERFHLSMLVSCSLTHSNMYDIRLEYKTADESRPSALRLGFGDRTRSNPATANKSEAAMTRIHIDHLLKCSRASASNVLEHYRHADKTMASKNPRMEKRFCMLAVMTYVL